MKLALKRPSLTQIPRHWLVPNWQQEFTVRRLLMLAAAILASIGVIMVASASMGIASADFNNPFYFFIRHLIYVLMGVTAATVAAQIPMHFWQRWSWYILIISFVLLILVLIPGIGRRINGSARWLGAAGITIQPSEIGKFAVVLFMSGYLVRRQEAVRTTYFTGLLRAGIIIGLTIALFMAEPDFGASLVLMSAILGMLFLGGAPLAQFGLLFAGVVGGAIALAFSADYRVKRLMSFWEPWDDAYGTDYQLSQSLIAFGRGDWFGVGLGHSVQKLFYLPEAHTDFVFAIYAEEFGLVGVFVLLIAFFMLVQAGVRIGRNAAAVGKLQESYLAYGMIFLMLMQAIINISVCTGLFPTKGLTLPFISYGGSSLVVVFTMLGILLRIDAETTIAKQGGTP
ncbi:putative lipid II flippase FtsW [Agitococcus lubricus]|uniref:Probable peptidoglycan glycosyltransferase FtsW n=1 Tax=Agitococcus lubricus TaxID=1077255 RepID=A0A2T5J0K5_9GAMM|nr:putative lipid II flippase FtsW [Agitococcus lubricus]PTQ89873.1 cell division-specific peptidoglycan biosynthesis regulator FtsW [Agitococcus lubricus]